MNNSALQGVLFMLLNMLAMTCIDSCSKLLRETMSSAHIVFLYKLFLLLGMMPWVLSKGMSAFKTDRIHVHIIRSLLSVLGLLFFIQGLHYVDIADAAALENIQAILLVFIGVIFFQEKKSITKIIAVVFGFIGAIVVVNPRIISFSANISNDKYYIFTLIGIGFWTLNSVVVKILGKTEKNRTQMFYLVFFSWIWSIPIALVKWDSVNIVGMNLSLIPTGLTTISDLHIEFWHIKYILFMSVSHFVHGVSYFRALKSEISIVEPFRYSKFIFSAIFGYLFFQETPSFSAYVGFGFIIFSGLILFLIDMRRTSKVL